MAFNGGFLVGSSSAVTYNYYRVPETMSARANRDFEFWWSQTYADSNHVPVSANSDTNHISLMGRTLCEVYSNSLGLPYSDMQLMYDYLNFPGSSRDTLYHLTGPTGFLVDASGDSADRDHIDAYLFAVQDHLLSGGWPQVAAAYHSAYEDTSSGHAPNSTFNHNTIQTSGPTFQGLADFSDTSWSAPDRGNNAVFIHEVQHTMNDQRPDQNTSELWSVITEVLCGPQYDRVVDDSPYTWPIIEGGGSGHHPDIVWRSFAAYLLFNFRGDSTRTWDDLVWRWSHGANQSLIGLGSALKSDRCSQCTQSYLTQFADQDSLGRLDMLLHNWRVASYVENYSLAEHQYGFGPAVIRGVTYQPGYSHANNSGGWQDINPDTAAHNNIVVPGQLSADATWQTTTISTNLHPSQGGNDLGRPLQLALYGADYLIIHGNQYTGSDTLVIRIGNEGISKSDYWSVGSLCGTHLGGTGRMRVSVVTYSQDSDSLFRHGSWVTGTQSQFVDVDSIANDLQFVVPGFGDGVKAVLVVATLNPATWLPGTAVGDGPPPIGFRVTAGIRKAPVFSPETNQLVATEEEPDAAPTWSPDGSQVAFSSMIGSATRTLIYRVSSAGGTPTPIQVSTTVNQSSPHWSPRGDWIAFEQTSSSGPDLWMKNLDTDEHRHLTSQAGYEKYPTFRPDGQRVAFFSKPSGTSVWKIKTVDLNGANAVELATTSVAGPGLRWSPDGSAVWFAVHESLFVVGAGGGTALYKGSLAPEITSFDLHPGTGQMVVEKSSSYSRTYICLCTNSEECELGGTGALDWQRVGVRDTSASASTRYLFTFPGALFKSPRWSYDGTRIAYVSDQNAGDDDLFVGSPTYNHPPVFSTASVRDTLLFTCRAWQRDLSATDPDGETVTYQPVMLPDGAWLQSGYQLHWTPSQVGDYYIVLRALDGSGGVAHKVIKVTVDDIGLCEEGCPPNCPEALTTNLPKVFSLAQNRPNPFAGRTDIHFGLPTESRVEIEVLDVQGRLIRRLTSATLPAGFHVSTWNGTNAVGNRVGPGLYFYRMRAGTFTDRKRLVLLP
jgi:hypothetical protein